MPSRSRRGAPEVHDRQGEGGLRDKFFSAVESGFGFCDVVFGWDTHDQCERVGKAVVPAGELVLS